MIFFLCTLLSENDTAYLTDMCSSVFRLLYCTVFPVFISVCFIFSQSVVSGLATHTVRRLVPYQSVLIRQDIPMEITSPNLSCDEVHQDITFNLVPRLFSPFKMVFSQRNRHLENRAWSHVTCQSSLHPG